MIWGQETKGRNRAGMKGGAGCDEQERVPDLVLWECCQTFPFFCKVNGNLDSYVESHRRGVGGEARSHCYHVTKEF